MGVWLRERTCIVCDGTYRDDDLTDEQFVLENKDFCPQCWNELIYD